MEPVEHHLRVQPFFVVAARQRRMRGFACALFVTLCAACGGAGGHHVAAHQVVEWGILFGGWDT
jgi:hypothetical protein